MNEGPGVGLGLTALRRPCPRRHLWRLLLLLLLLVLSPAIVSLHRNLTAACL